METRDWASGSTAPVHSFLQSWLNRNPCAQLAKLSTVSGGPVRLLLRLNEQIKRSHSFPTKWNAFIAFQYSWRMDDVCLYWCHYGNSTTSFFQADSLLAMLESFNATEINISQQRSVQQEGNLQRYVDHKHGTMQHFLEFPENATDDVVKNTAKQLQMKSEKGFSQSRTVHACALCV